jgi:hypothetical protein
MTSKLSTTDTEAAGTPHFKTPEQGGPDEPFGDCFKPSLQDSSLLIVYTNK